MKVFPKWAEDSCSLFPCGIFLYYLEAKDQGFTNKSTTPTKSQWSLSIEVTKVEKFGTSHAQLVYYAVFFEALNETKVLNQIPLKVKLLSPQSQLKTFENPSGKITMASWQWEATRTLFLWTLKGPGVNCRLRIQASCRQKEATGKQKAEKIFDFFEGCKYQLATLPFQTLILNSHYPEFVSLWNKIKYLVCITL